MNLPWYRRIFAFDRNGEIPKVEIDTAPGQIDAQFLLGLRYSLGADAARALESYRLAADRGNAPGWIDAGKTGDKNECLAYIQSVWTDMRPLSLREKMAEASAQESGP